MNYANSVAMKLDVVKPSWLWHKRLMHLNFQSLKTLQQHVMLIGLSSIQEGKEAYEGARWGSNIKKDRMEMTRRMFLNSTKERV